MEVAKKIVGTWKRVLQLEWWRHMLATQSERVSELQRKWIQNEDKRTERIYGEKNSRRMLPLTKTLDDADLEQDLGPPSHGADSKKRKREADNAHYLGGMRNPSVVVLRLQMVKAVGLRIRRRWEAFVEKWPRARNVGEKYGTPEAKVHKETLEMWQQELHDELKARRGDGLRLRENVEFVSPLNADLSDAWGRESRDPERFIGQWAREGAPLGMEKPIDPSNGIYPPSNAGGERLEEEAAELTEMRGLRNYLSMEEQAEDAEIEIDRYLQLGFVKKVPWAELEARHGRGTVSRLALIVKEKPDGSKKRRVIIDLRRSNGNARSRVEERIVLPRAVDVLAMTRDLARNTPKLAAAEAEAAVPAWRMSKPEEVATEFILLDMKDAFCHFPIHPAELRHCISPGLDDKTGLMWVAMLFGFAGAPLVMGRLSAAVGRLIASLFNTAELQDQVYVDDVFLASQGSRQARNNHVSLVIYTLRAFGVNLSLAKGERGVRVTWIGTVFEIQDEALVIAAPEKLIKEIAEQLETWQGAGMIPQKTARKLAGKLSWLAGILPRLRWAVSSLYGAIGAAEAEDRTGQEARRATTRDKDRRVKEGLVPVKRFGAALPWLKAALTDMDGIMRREEPLKPKASQWLIVTDACPFGLGAILVRIQYQGGYSSQTPSPVTVSGTDVSLISW